MHLSSCKSDKIHYMTKVPIQKLKGGVIRVVLPLEFVVPIITIETNRHDKLTSITICPVKRMTIEESAILLHVLDYLFYKTTNNLNVGDEIAIDESVLPKTIVGRNLGQRKLLVAIYDHHDRDEREYWWETLLYKNEVWIRLFFNEGKTTNFNNLLQVELKFNRQLLRDESWRLAYFIVFVAYMLGIRRYDYSYGISIYSGDQDVFDEKLIELFMRDCKKCYVDYISLADDLDISQIEDCTDDFED